MDVKGTYHYRPLPQSIAGSRYSDILPTQDHVSPTIINQKIQELKESGQPARIPVYYAGDRLSLYHDRHHTFAAAVEIGHPIELNLIKPLGAGLPNPRTDWRDTTRSDFDRPAWRR